MSKRAVALAVAAGLVWLPGASAQEAAKPPAAPHVDPRPLYAGLAKLPDWSGVWQPDWSSLFRERGAPANPPQLTPEAAKKSAAFLAAQAKGENLQTDAANCIPTGVPGIMRQPYPIEFVFAPHAVYIITETFSQVRRVYTDGRKLPDDPDLWFNGHSVGRWEGEALVVETVGLNPRNVLQPGLTATEQTVVRERIWKEAPDRLVIETTLTDPTIFTRPFVSRQAYMLKPDWEMREYVCAENNKDAADPFGRPTMSLD